MPELELMIEKFSSHEVDAKYGPEEDEDSEDEDDFIKLLPEEPVAGKENLSNLAAVAPDLTQEQKNGQKPGSVVAFDADVDDGIQGDLDKSQQSAAFKRGNTTTKKEANSMGATATLLNYDPNIIHPNFRLLLTSMPCDYFPITILQNGVKLTNEPPKGIKSNLLKTYSLMSSEQFTYFDQAPGGKKKFTNIDSNELVEKSSNWKKLLFSISLLHAVVLERAKFGPLGWNIIYDFNESDLKTTFQMVQILLERYSEIPWAAMKYLASELNYGGRVTDDWDRRTLFTVYDIFINEEIMEEGSLFTAAQEYFMPNISSLDECMVMIKELPDLDPPSIFGMSTNAEVAYQIKESNKLLTTVLNLQPKEVVVDGGDNPDEQVINFITKLEESIIYVTLREGEKKPLIRDFTDSLEVCMVQEIERFRLLLGKIQQSLKDLRSAIKGESIMSQELGLMYASFQKNQVPDLWVEYAYPSLKGLNSWFEDLKLRVQFFNNWYLNQKPFSFWLSAFFFPQGFLTSVLQFHSRKKEIAISKLKFSFSFKNAEANSISSHPEFGCYIHGLFMEGGRIESARMILVDNPEGVMNSQAPMIHFIPTENVKENPADYQMPLYKTMQRAGSLSATGHSTNFILTILTPTKVDPQYWILNGAAYICALN